MQTKLLSATLVAAMTLPMMLASQSASAKFANGFQDTRFVGGSCRPTNASNAAHAQVDSKGRIFNTSPTQVLVVDCAVQRDPFEAKATQVTVYAIDQKAHLGSNLHCTFSMVNPITGKADSQSLFATSDTANTPSTAVPIKSSFLPGLNHTALNCFIPAADANGNKQSGIAAYFVTEQSF